MQILKMNNAPFTKIERVLLKAGRAINAVADSRENKRGLWSEE